MKTIRKLAIALTLASSALSAAPLVTLQPESLFAESGKAFKIDVTLSFNSLAELGEIAELSAFGFNFSNSGNLVFSSMQLHSSYDDFSLFSNEVVGLAGLTGGSTASPVTIASFLFTPVGEGPASFSITGDRLDPSGVFGLYYTTLGDLSDPLDDRTFAFDVAGATQITVASAVPEPSTMGAVAGALALALAAIRRHRKKN